MQIYPNALVGQISAEGQITSSSAISAGLSVRPNS